ncbi:MAG: helix-turn-helix domain-containing protein [Acidimicrobiales bacterium]
MTTRNAAAASAPSAPLIDIAQAAERLGVTPRFVRRLVEERRIPFHKIGKYVRFDPADIDRFAMHGRVEPVNLVAVPSPPVTGRHYRS